MRHTIIPDEMSLAVGGVAIALLVYEYTQTQDYMLVVYSLGAGLGAFAFFGGLWYVSGGRWIGFGDAKLALPLGVIVGLGSVFSMVVLSFWIGAVISLLLLGVGKMCTSGKMRLHFRSLPRTIKSEVPFAPFLILGFLAVHFFHADIFTFTYTIFFGDALL
jgi:prepilin signal peptidase PulO-like enzyme (type II secretory pathway)